LVNTFGDLLKHSFFLVIPKQQNNPQRLREFEEKILQQWISELPVANLGLATRLIYDFILEFNALAMPSQLRFDTLELLRPSLLMVEEYLRSKLTKNLFPKDENDQKVLKLLVALQRQFTIGYWIVVKELTENESRWFKSKNAAISMQRTIKGLGNIIVSYLIMGMRMPDWVWIDLHALYFLSVKTKKNAIQVVNWDNNAIKKTSSPEECYLQILLLSLADSSGMLQKEIIMVHRFIETVCPLVRISTGPVLMGEHECIVVTEEDEPPYFRHINDSKEIAQSLRKDMPAVLYLDFRVLNKALLDKNCCRRKSFSVHRH
jgi:cyclic-di-GMP-binding protein